MKILCICKQGIVRSGALVWLLKVEHAHDAVAVGYETNGSEVIKLLGTWADRIIALDNASYQSVPLVFISKTDVFNVGEDRWHDPGNLELHSILRSMIKERLQ